MGTITHALVSAVPDSGNAGEIEPSHWNAGHVFSLAKTDVGLANVDNISDANKPVSTAQAAADSAVAANAASALAAVVAGTLGQFGATTSAQLRAVLSDESGTGAAYFQGGDAGTPSAIVLTNGSGLSLASGVTGILPGANGGTGNGFFAISGPAASLKTYTVPNASCTLLTTNAVVTVAQGGIGVGTLTGLAKGNGTSAFTAAVAGTDFVAPGGALGTPSSGTLSSCTGYPVAVAADVRTGTDNAKIVTASALFAGMAPVVLTPGTTVALDLSTGVNFTLAPAQNFTLSNPTNTKAGQSGRIFITQDGTGSRTLAVGTNYKFMGGAKTLSTAAGTVDCINYFVIDSTHIYCELALAYA